MTHSRSDCASRAASKRRITTRVFGSIMIAPAGKGIRLPARAGAQAPLQLVEPRVEVVPAALLAGDDAQDLALAQAQLLLHLLMLRERPLHGDALDLDVALHIRRGRAAGQDLFQFPQAPLDAAPLVGGRHDACLDLTQLAIEGRDALLLERQTRNEELRPQAVAGRL